MFFQNVKSTYITLAAAFVKSSFFEKTKIIMMSCVFPLLMLMLMLMLMVFWFSKYILCNSLTKDCLYCFNLVVFDFVRLWAVKNYTVKWSCIVYQFVIANQRTDFLCFGCLRLFLSKFNIIRKLFDIFHSSICYCPLFRQVFQSFLLHWVVVFR